MEKLKTLLLGLLLVCSVSVWAQSATEITASKVGDNLDLALVSAEFGDSKDLEDFERRLNDPNSKISNLDINKDGQVDYLTVSERVEGDIHYVDIHASVGANSKTHVATIRVEKQADTPVVQVIGSTSLYGTNYVYVPVYTRPPFLFGLFWVAGYRPWVSPWRWGYYPTYYRPWGIRPYGHYRNDIDVNISKHTNINVNRDRGEHRPTPLDRDNNRSISQNRENNRSTPRDRGDRLQNHSESRVSGRQLPNKQATSKVRSNQPRAKAAAPQRSMPHGGRHGGRR